MFNGELFIKTKETEKRASDQKYLNWHGGANKKFADTK